MLISNNLLPRIAMSSTTLSTPTIPTISTIAPAILRAFRECARRHRSVAATVAGFVMLCIAASGVHAAAEIDPTFGGGRGYVPVIVAEPESDRVVAAVREPDNRIVVLGRRLVGTNNRSVLLLQRYTEGGFRDEFFGDQGTVTIDIPGVSLTPRDLLLQSTGRLLAVAETPASLRIFAIRPDGQPDTTWGKDGEIEIPLNPGIAPGSAVVHLSTNALRLDRLTVIMPTSPSPSMGLTLYRYLADGALDQFDFGVNGKVVLPDLAPGVAFNGVSTELTDGRFLVAGSATSPNDPTRVLVAVTRDGLLDTTFGTGGRTTPPELQGKTIRVITPLVSNSFLVASNTATLATLNRYDAVGRLDPQFGAGGTMRVEPAGGGLVNIADVVEQIDTFILVTGDTANSLFVGRYQQRGVIDPFFNAGRGPQVFHEGSAGATRGVMSINYDSSHTVTIGNSIAFGADPASPTAPSRAFTIRTIDGVLDPTYAGDGIALLFNRKRPANDYIHQVMPLPDGKIVTLSSTGTAGGLMATVSRFLPDGSLDRTFGDNGRASFRQNGPCEWPMQMAMQPDGKLVLLGTSFDNISCDSGTMYARRVDVNGNIEIFAVFYGQANRFSRSYDIAMQADGRSVGIGQENNALVIKRVTEAGFIDPSFGSNGSVLWVRGPGDVAKGGAILVQSDQKIVAAGSMNGADLVLLRTLPNGALDPSFGTGGVTLVNVAANAFLEAQALKQTPSGKLLMLARLGQRPILAQFNANGTLDTSFGSNGLVQLPLFVGGSQYSRFGLAVQPDGGIAVTGQTSDGSSSSMAVMRLTPTGQPDTQFGPGGILTYRPSAYYAAGATAIASTGDGGLIIGAYGVPGAMVLRVRGAVAAGTAVEFYNTTLNHYFVTADPAEVAAIEAGAAGPGWTRTGLGFRAYTSALGIPAGAIPVCRFYGSTAINPATGQRRGPNSHFYTAVPEECAAVKNDPGWTYESIAFHTLAPQPNGTCGGGLVPVYRVYNNRFAQNDSNHRYTTDLSVYQLMQSMGWLPEGIVFCTPAS